MIDDKQGLRDSRPQGGAGSPERNGFDAFAAFPTNKPPAVNVVVKRRRGTAAPQGDHHGMKSDRRPHDGTAHEERRPRVYQVRPSAFTASGQQPALAVEPDNRQPGEPDPNAVLTTLTKRRRARRDPTHAPGEVTRTVFEPAPPMAIAPTAEPDARPLDFIERAEVGYEQVMAELQQLSAKLDLALSARKFRIG